MKREKWLTLPVAAVLSFLLSFAGVMCLQSAFGLEANVRHVALGCAISATAFSLGYTVKFWYIPLLVLAPVAGWLWQKGSLANSAEWLLYRLSATYDQAYNSGVLFWSDAIPTAGDGTMALCAIGCLVDLVSAWVICRKKPAFLAALTALLPLATCFVVTDRVPQTRYLFWLLLGIVVLLLSQLTRRQDARKGNLLTLLVTVPAALGLLILFWAVPQSTYKGQERADRILQTVETWIEELSGRGTAGTSTGLDQTVELDEIGRLVQAHTPVMTVSFQSFAGGQSKPDTIYLRQQGFQMYDGTSWYNEYGNDIYQWIQWDQLAAAGEITITTRSRHLMKFVPYYAEDFTKDSYGHRTRQAVTVNAMGITENLQQAYGYSFYLYQLPADAPSAEVKDREGGIYLPVGEYTPDAISLPASTVEWAEPMALSLVEGKKTVQARAEAIGDYVRNLAEYSRNTGPMSAGETDFARWFAFEAETGYCVHFATTAAVLLRAAGIQAQYVEGYVARVDQDGTAATVYEDQAHAWVEYYDPAVGWRILECTPAEGVPSYVSTPQTTTPTQPQAQQTPTQPQQTQPEPGGEQQAKPVWKVLWWILGVLGGLLTVFAQWQLRLRLQRRALEKGPVNIRAVKLWREIVRLSRLLKRRPPQKLFQLAQKAKFSQHVLTAQELAQLTEALDTCRQALKAKPWYFQPVYTVILAVF